MRASRTLAVGALAAASAAVSHRLLTARVASSRWVRTNHAGEPVTLLEGPAYVTGAALGAAAAGPAGVVAALGAGAFGALDDLAGDAGSKGLRGHLGAALEGRVTTGLVKVAGIGATGLVAAGLATGAAMGVLRPDLAGTAMLGDTGANAAGALVGTALLSGTGRRGRLVALVVLTALTLASEKVSFTRVIESTPGLRELDAWGRPAR